MLSRSAPAQLLPSDIVSLVLEYDTLQSLAPSDIQACRKSIVKESLSMCSTWRLAALEKLWKTLHLSISEEKETIYIANPGWARQFELPCAAKSLARQLKVNVSMTSITSGKAYKLLSSFMGDTVSLPLVRKILVMINNYPIEEEYIKDYAIHNSIEFAQLINSIPTNETTETEVKYNGTSTYIPEVVEGSLGVFLNELYTNTRRPILYLNMLKFLFASNIDRIPQLSTLSVRWEDDLDLKISLVHRCASTLQCLDVSMPNAMTLLYDANNNSIIYPNLRQLVLPYSTSSTPVDRATAMGVVPFPKLVTLSIPFEYPFYDDVLFRGNSDTLESLELCVDTETTNVLNRCQVFDGKHKNLRTVIISEGNHIRGRTNTSTIVTSNLLAKMTRSTEKLVVFSSPLITNLMIATYQGRYFRHVRLLELRKGLLSLASVLRLLKHFPVLAKLTCGISEIGNELKVIDLDKLPEHIASMYSESENMLQTFGMTYYSNTFEVKSADIALLLALACPRLCRVGVLKANIVDFNGRTKGAIQNGPYSKFASRLSRLYSMPN